MRRLYRVFQIGYVSCTESATHADAKNAKMVTTEPSSNMTIDELVEDIVRLKGTHAKANEAFQKHMHKITARLSEMKQRQEKTAKS